MFLLRMHQHEKPSGVGSAFAGDLDGASGFNGAFPLSDSVVDLCSRGRKRDAPIYSLLLSAARVGKDA